MVKLGERPTPARISRGLIGLPDWVTRLRDVAISIMDRIRALDWVRRVRRPHKHERHDL